MRVLNKVYEVYNVETGSVIGEWQGVNSVDATKWAIADLGNPPWAHELSARLAPAPAGALDLLAEDAG